MQDNIYDWIGRQQITEDEIGLTLVRRAAAMVDMDPGSFSRGDALPPHWYSMFFTPNARASEIGHDGHPRKGDFFPPIPLPRRMFVGRDVEFFHPLVVGEQAHKISEIASITPKEGRSGKLVFLQIKHTVKKEDGRTALVELQNVVYKSASTASASEKSSVVAAGGTPGLDAAWSEEHIIDPVLLYRYSALTWNGHRIHYDCDYARDKEGYPTCVVNGALTLHLLIGAALNQCQDMFLTRIKARLSSPMFMGEKIQLGGTALQPVEDGMAIKALARSGSGATAATAELFFEKRSIGNG
ncbi:hypothetical protein ERD78_00025 [Allopusillimonas soli]|uniref:MaoC family dehydratase N-terminal domain-containing protein n=1 Tax=Allopusillimonas soli TaxID=659016 RepID=A0A853FB06_9BURK|nr:MaoC family dehydratase N-terminal domain-containing protein [Allopusillimonas soli]NYT35246.1 MaoC family dehydratase N-terminal domain-containing protein [Allopusillimonas soli]TEA75674.1 hypothetical protein ERD78_00025 [Allopusillimonas soli]